MCQLVGEDATGGDVIAVAEAAGDGEELKLVQRLRPLEQAVDVHERRLGPRQFERVGRLTVTELLLGAGVLVLVSLFGMIQPT